ncbi:helix-turn-helix domain-containing protein [Xenorhabdus bovienii]|uniref:Putative phage regulator n=1 Tax=Xenorhabdus bovienii TaxID=40576 RepID=A0A0B6XFS0_XENBV|nr:helix-turn-helix transcriptional regulator [Xenorhabdus bovienii]MDE1486949.1 helix-turn-helix domain-containing protein [Xenorhabdus bovienii]MDE1497203.1 helix-turn-helix domain-containing protein [Xenorhabdus bovienii]MDE9474748.1 helix-turn-helix domain-containing protein [Xenorhabdus bovienii]MDE9477791.1 helix-turn-helix domain-containing protein [Xenorhabdus bovienii]MDE9494606.1 helix-turn-helix domain-containing protein [Xenorhabdus bovienii]
MNKKISRAIGNRIKMRRKALKVTMVALSQSIGVSQPQLLRCEKGDRQISAAQLFQIAMVLNTPLDWFFTDCFLYFGDIAPSKTIDEG